MADERSVDVTNPTDQSPPRQSLDALISEAFGAARTYPTRDRCEEIERRLRAEIGDLHLAAREALAGSEEYSRDWWRFHNALADTDHALTGDLGDGLLSAALHVAELARQVQALRAVLGR